jgi:DNA adenine methylase
MATVPSLIKWTGSKRSQAQAIVDLMPPYNRYIEPFLGGGAVLYLAAVEGSIVSDIYEPLVRLWQVIQRNPDRVVADYSEKWRALNEELDAVDLRSLKKGDQVPEIFYSIRERFNRESDPLDLCFITRTCVNGIVRFNGKGEFNNSFHLSRRGMNPNRFRRTVQAWHSVLRGVEICCQDYRQALEAAEPGDFVYLDPPYAGSRNRYIADLDVEALYSALEALNQKGVSWALSFDGRRGEQDLTAPVPQGLYKRQLLLSSGNSAVGKVLNGPVEGVHESLYLNY